jgi:hypothetical protein
MAYGDYPIPPATAPIFPQQQQPTPQDLSCPTCGRPMQLAGDVVPFPISGAAAARNTLRSQMREGKAAYESTLPATNTILPMDFLLNAVKRQGP